MLFNCGPCSIADGFIKKLLLGPCSLLDVVQLRALFYCGWLYWKTPLRTLFSVGCCSLVGPLLLLVLMVSLKIQSRKKDCWCWWFWSKYTPPPKKWPSPVKKFESELQALTVKWQSVIPEHLTYRADGHLLPTDRSHHDSFASSLASLARSQNPPTGTFFTGSIRFVRCWIINPYSWVICIYMAVCDTLKI